MNQNLTYGLRERSGGCGLTVNAKRVSAQHLEPSLLDGAAPVPASILASKMYPHKKHISETKVLEEPRRIGGINLTFHFPLSLELDEKQKTVLERAAHNCPVIHSINPEIAINADFNWNA